MSDIAIGKARTLLDVSELPAKLIREALTVAGADSKFPDGFKSLAQLGTTYIDAAFLEMGYKGSLSREVISDVRSNYNTMKYRAIVAGKLGIQHLIEYGKNGKETEKNLAFAISALIATVHLTRGPDAVRACVTKLGFLDEGPGLQMWQKYEAVMVEHSVPIAINQPSVTAALVQSGTTINEQSPPLPDQPNSQTEASSSENDSFHVATPETSLTSECTGLIPFDLPRELDDLYLGNRGTDHFEDNQGFVETIHTAQIVNAFNSEPQQIPVALPFFNTMPSFLENPEFSVQAEALCGLTFCQRSVEVEDDTTVALEDEQSCIANVSDMARKRKAIDESYVRKSKRVNTGVRPKWAISLTKEMERCQSRKTRIPPEVFFREDIEARCSAMGPRFTELLTLILVQIADSSSFVCLRDAIRASKRPELDKPQKISTQTSMEDRFNILEKLDGEIAYNALLKRYHLLELFTNCGGNEGGEDMTIIHYTADNTASQGGRRGNPIRIALAEVTKRMMRKEFPSLSPGTEEYESRKRTMTRYRALASRFQAFVDKFGRAILCFIQPCQGKSVSNWGISDNKIREISDTSLKDFIEVLDQSQGDYLRSVCGGAEPLLKCLVYENSPTAEFAIEHTEAVDILQLPKGSDKLLRLLQHTSEDGAISEIR